jgi:hypothetical protein
VEDQEIIIFIHIALINDMENFIQCSSLVVNSIFKITEAHQHGFCFNRSPTDQSSFLQSSDTGQGIRVLVQ